MTDKEKSLRIEINNSIDKIINGVVHPHTEREKLVQVIVKLFAIPDVVRSLHKCEKCGEPMTEVRPGKWQCDNQYCPWQ